MRESSLPRDHAIHFHVSESECKESISLFPKAPSFGPSKIGLFDSPEKSSAASRKDCGVAQKVEFYELPKVESLHPLCWISLLIRSPFWIVDQVFKKSQLLPICRKLFALKSSGKPMVLKESLDVLPNSYWGIRGAHQAARTMGVWGCFFFKHFNSEV